MNKIIYDIEVSPNFVLLGFRDLSKKEDYQFEAFGVNASLSSKDIKKIRKLIKNNTLIGFNNHSYDDPMTAFILNGATCEDIFSASTHLIHDKISKWKAHRELEVTKVIENSIDLIDVARGQASLKLYGARLHSKTIQDLPYAYDMKLTKSQAKDVAEYNINDLDVTELLYNTLQTDLKLRESIGLKYDINVMSMNGAKVAEAILLSETGFTGKAPSQPDFIEYTPPKYIKFKTPELKAIFKKIKSHKFLIMNFGILSQIKELGNGEYSFLLDDLGIEKTTKKRYGKKNKKTISDSGNVISPDFLDKPIVIDEVSHKLGLGGVHGSVISTTIIPEDDEIIVDIDYKSLYPSMKIVNKFYPLHMGKGYLKTYSYMYHTRNNVLKPKLKTLTKGTKEYIDVYNEQDIMKLVLNSSFGKEGEKYSKLFDPSSLIHTTLTGQLTLMMVIEKLHLKGFKTFYANTDGITLKIKKSDLDIVQKITRKFDKKTQLEMEYNFFKSSHIRDVNNFVNIDVDGTAKSKGAYGESSIEKNSEYPIVFKTIREYLCTGKALYETLRECNDIAQFCSSRQVTGGAVYSDEKFPNTPEYDNYIDNDLKKNMALEKRNSNYQKELIAKSTKTKYIGKVVRVYFSKEGRPLYYKKTHNKVPKTGDYNGVKAMMTLAKKIPKDLDYDAYLGLCNTHLRDLGVTI